MNFTPSQLAAIAAPEPYCLVSAGPGAAKTTVLVARVQRLLRSGGPPQRVVIITYTNAAANELNTRLVAGDSVAHSIGFCGTLHGWILSLLTAHGHFIGLQQPLAVIDEEEQSALLADALDETAYRGSLKAVQAEVAKGPQARVSPMVFALAIGSPMSPAQIAAEAFFQKLSGESILTYDMILHAGERLLRALPAGTLAVDHLMLDEAQDLTQQDWRIIEATGVPNVWACGDFDQAVFGWRSGDRRNGFEERLSGCSSERTSHRSE